MVSTIELQVSATRFTDALLQSLRATPRRLPDPAYGFQVQRVRYLSAALRRDQPSSYQIFRTSAIDVGLGYIWIEGRQPQLAVDLEISVLTDASLEANVNRVPTPDVVLRGTLVFDLDARQGNKIGSIELTAALSDLVTGVDFPSLPGHDDAKAWAMDQLSAQLALTPMTFDLSYAVPSGRQFENVGLSVSAAGDFLALRAEVTGLGNETRWTNFHNGFVDSSLGGQDWAVVLLPKDIELTLQTTLWDALAREIGPSFQNVAVQYAGHGDRATFRITAWIEVYGALGVVVGTQAVTIGVTAWLDGSGTLVLDVDGSQADDIGSGLQAVIAGLAALFVPVVGWLVAALLYELIGEALDQLSAAVADLAEGFAGLPPGTTVEEIDADRFVYRVRIPFQTPAAIDGRITGISAGAEALALRGSYTTANLVEGDLQVDVSRFAWIAPKVSCGASGDAALHAFDDDPAGSATVYAQVELSTTGTVPVSVDDIVIRQMSSAVGATVRFDRGGSRLPTTLTLELPSYMVTTGAFDEPIVIDVRTSAGVVRCRFDPPTLPTEADLRLMRSAIRVQLEVCDTKVRPDWWLGKHGFIPDWVDHGLEDPDHIDVRTGIQVLVTSGIPGLTLELAHAEQVIATATLDAEGNALVETLLVAGEVPEVRLRVPPGIEDSPAYAAALAQVEAGQRPSGSSFAVYRTELTSLGRTHLADTQSVLAAQRAGAGHFLARSGDEQVLLVAGRGSARPTVQDVWLVGSDEDRSRRRRTVDSVLGNGAREKPTRPSYGASAWLTEGVWSGDVMARATGHGVEFWRRSGEPVLVPPPAPE